MPVTATKVCQRSKTKLFLSILVQSGNDTNTIIENIEEYTTYAGNFHEEYSLNKFNDLVRQMNDSFRNII